MNTDKNLIDLQNCHATQLRNSTGEITDWSVQQNITNNVLTTLPRDWDEKTVFTALDFAREFELIALNIGINHGVKKMVTKHNTEKTALINRINALTESNDRLASKLGELIGESEE